MTKFEELEQRAKNSINNGHVIAILWGIDDVAMRADSLEVELSEAETIEVLELAVSQHDAGYGMNWDSIDAAILDFEDDRGRNSCESINN